MTTVYEALHHLVDRMPEDDAASLLSELRRRQMAELEKALDEAPLEDEEISAEEEAEVAIGRAEWLRGETRPLIEVMEELRRA